jgi:hypothetical protein
MARLFARAKQAAPTEAAVSLKLALRKLWTEHVVWTHEYILSAVAGSADSDHAAKRLLRNQDDIGAAVASVYGKPAGAKTTKLLKEHILIAVDLLAAAKAGRKKDFARHDARWTQNAKDLAEFLATANPHLAKKDLGNLLSLHLQLTKEFAVARLEERWDDAIGAYDDILVEIITLSDALADGIVTQFPEKFE